MHKADTPVSLEASPGHHDFAGQRELSSFAKLRSIFHSPGLSALTGWAACVRGQLVLICILNVLASLCSLGVTLATKGFIDGAVSSKADALWRYGILLAVLVLLSRAFSSINAIIRTKASAHLQHSLQSTLVKELFTRDYAHIKSYHSGELVNRYFSDVSVVKNGILGILPGLISIAVSFVGAAAILLYMDWRFVILLVGGGLLGLLIVLLFRKPMKQRHKRIQEAQGGLHASVQEALENIRLIKSSVSENRTRIRIGIRQDVLRDEQIRQGRFSIAMNHSMGLVFDLSWLFCMIWGCLSIFHGRLTYGSLAAMIQLVGRIQGPVASSVSLASQIYSVVSSAERLLELTGIPEEKPGETLPDFDCIRLEDVTFQYDDGTEDVLRHISFTIPKGEFIALTGISGGGKTSLFQLLLGIYHPTSGKIQFCLGGRSVPASSGTRSLFAYVPQGNTLFSGTLRDNFAMFTDSVSDEEILQAARTACIDTLISEIGLDAVLGERGIGLSEGQAQRVAIARALLSKAPILLLDESTSALDEQTEAQLLKNLSVMQDKTCLIVTHRRAALAICGQVLHMEEGTVQQSVP